jgi:hypothetical protein
MTGTKNHSYSTFKQGTKRHECITALLVLYGIRELSAFYTHSCKEVILFKDSESAGELSASFEVDGIVPAAVDAEDSGASHLASDQVTNEVETCR